MLPTPLSYVVPNFPKDKINIESDHCHNLGLEEKYFIIWKINAFSALVPEQQCMLMVQINFI